MKFTTKLLLCSAIPAAVFVIALAVGVGGVVHTRDQFSSYMKTEQRVHLQLTDMYAQGLQMGQALRNVILDPANKIAYDNLENAGKGFEKAYEQAAAAARGTPLLSALERLPALRQATAQAQAKVLATVKDQSGDAVKLLNSTETPAWRALRKELLAQLDAAGKVSSQVEADVNAQADRVVVYSGLLALLAVLTAIGLNIYLRRSVNQELGGDPADARLALAEIADGNLSHPVPATRFDASLMAGLARMQTSLRRLVGDVRQATDSIATASGQIAAGSQDLSGRTESQASALQETAASMEELGSTVRQNADNARQANQLAQSASAVATQGGDVVNQVVQTMQGIDAASKKIAEIINVIDGIAFQTNILALNAAVEAARAGEQGRGFAVVASEVRALAGRSAEAAKEIKALITDSAARVDEGNALVARAGSTMQDVVQGIQRVTDIMGEISAASGEQSTGVAQVGEAVTQMDQATQQNAALVEQSTAAAQSLSEQARHLSELMTAFRLRADEAPQTSQAPAPAAVPAVAGGRRQMPRLVKS